MKKMSLEDFEEKAMSSPFCTYVVEIMLKYDHEDDYRTTTEVYDKESSEDPDSWVWLNDWYEGEDEIWVIGAAAINKIDVVGRFDFDD